MSYTNTEQMLAAAMGDAVMHNPFGAALHNGKLVRVRVVRTHFATGYPTGTGYTLVWFYLYGGSGWREVTRHQFDATWQYPLQAPVAGAPPSVGLW